MYAKRLVSAMICIMIFCASAFAADPENAPAEFGEIWAYLMSGEEAFLKNGYPISDIAYFSARISDEGKLFALPKFSRLPESAARKHLVVAETGNFALIHFVLAPAFGLRDRLIEDIANAAVPYDGVQIDFEAVLSTDKENFTEFLKKLKERIPGKTLSIALPARTGLVDDAYNYAGIAPIVDRILVMAYDEHWSGSKAGPIASLAWCTKVATYARSVVSPEKLVMGLPFYGRAWSDKNPAGAYKFASAQRLLLEKTETLLRDEEGIPYFSFSETINLTLFFEDAQSLLKRAGIYRGSSIKNIGFWRLGQEDPEIWSRLAITK